MSLCLRPAEVALMKHAFLLVLFVAIASGRPLEDDQEDVRRAIPGEPGRDYPTLGAVPVTGFSCRSEGFFADPETRCQVFHICALQRGVMGRQSFLCPNGTIFNAHVNTCDWWNKVHCRSSPSLADVADNSQLHLNTETTQEPTSKLKSNDRAKITQRKKPSDGRINLFSETSNQNFDDIEFRQIPISNRGSVQILRGNDQDFVKTSRQPLINSISTEGYAQTSTKDFSKPLITKDYSTAWSKSNRVTEVTIKPRVRYTHSLKANSDNPFYSLNPLIHLARDSSLLSSFIKSTDSTIKVSHPVERYVVNDVLPQYISKNSAMNTTEIPKFQPEVTTEEPSDPVDGDQINPPDDDDNPIYFPDSLIPPLGSVVENHGSNFESNALQRRLNNGYIYNEPTLSTNISYNENRNYVKDQKKHYFIKVGSNVLSSSRNKPLSDNYPSVVRVTSGYTFTPTVTNNYGYSTPKTVRVSNSYAVEENFSTEGPEINTNTYSETHKGTSTSLLNAGKSINKGISSDEIPISINRLQDTTDSQILQSQNSGSYDGDIHVPALSDKTNIDFINRFIVDESLSQSPSLSGNNPTGFDTFTHTTPANVLQPVSNNYLASSPDYNSFSAISEWTRADAITQTPSNTINSQASGDGYNVNNVYTTPSARGESYTNLPGHYITLEPPGVSRTSANQNYRQNYGYTSETIQYTGQNLEKEKSYSSLLNVQSKTQNRGNLYSTTQSPERVVTSPATGGVSSFSQPSISNTYSLPEENSVGRTHPNFPSYLSRDNNAFSQGYSTKSQDIPFQHNYHSITPQYPKYNPVQQGIPLSGNEKTLTTDKSVEIVDDREKENILSGLQISNVLPSVEAYSWSTIVPSSSTAKEGLQPQENLENYNKTFATTSLDNYNENQFQRYNSGTPTPPSSSSLRSSVGPTPYSRLLSSELFSKSNYSTQNLPHKSNSFVTGRTTATFLNNNEEVNLYSPSTADSVGTIFDTSTVNNAHSLNSSLKKYGSQSADGFSTERNFFQQSTQDDYLGSIKDSSSLEVYKPAFSTPGPFSESPKTNSFPQRYSTTLPEGGKQFLNPADLLGINSLRSSTESKKNVNEVSAELIKSIGFSFDNVEDREQFEIAKSKGWFNL